MAKILLVADSNVANNLNLIKTGKIKNMKFVKCVDKKEFSTAILEAEVDTDVIMVAAFDAIANEVAKKPGYNDRAIEVIFSHFCMKLYEKSEDSDIKIGVIPPLYWRAHSKETRRAMKHSYELLQKDLNNFIYFAPDLPPMKTLSDKIHLTERSGENYIKFIYKQLETLAQSKGKTVAFEYPSSDWNESESAGSDQPMETEEGVELGMSEDESTPTITPTRTASIAATVLRATSTPAPATAIQQRLINMAGPLEGHMAPLRPRLDQRPILNPAASHAHRFDLGPSTTFGEWQFSVPPPTLATDPYEMGRSIRQLNVRVTELETKSYYDNIVMANLRETQDTEWNIANLRKVVISGIKISNFGKATSEEKTKAMKDEVGKLVDLVKGENPIELKYVRQLNGQVRNPKHLVVEARFGDDNQAIAFRKSLIDASKKQKQREEGDPEEGMSLEGISVAPVVRLATRVRVEILKAMADVITAQRNDFTAYCQQYAPRPVLKLRSKATTDRNSPPITLGLTDSIAWMRAKNLLSQVNLKAAYSRAGSTYGSTLEQTFIILNNKEQ